MLNANPLIFKPCDCIIGHLNLLCQWALQASCKRTLCTLMARGTPGGKYCCNVSHKLEHALSQLSWIVMGAITAS